MKKNYLTVNLLVIFLALFSFYPGLQGGFLFDDTANIVRNTSLHIRHITLENLAYAAYSFEPGGSSRPLAMLSFALNFWHTGLDPFYFKLTNLVIHGLTSVVLLYFFHLLLSVAGYRPHVAQWGALFLTLFWSIHPIQISSVLYVVQRMQTLANLCVLLALLCYLYMRQAQITGNASRIYGILLLFFWILGFSSKEDAVLLPAYTLALELTVLKFDARNTDIRDWLRRIYGLMVVCGTLVFCFYIIPKHWQWTAPAGRDFSSLERLLTQARVLCMYLGQMLWPSPASMPFFYDDLQVSRGVFMPGSTLPALIFIILLLITGWIVRVRRPLIALGIFLFFSGHFVTSNIISLELAFEHRNIIPLIGVALIVFDVIFGFLTRENANVFYTFTIFIFIIFSMGILSYMRSTDWGDNLRLAEKIVTLSPQSERAWALLCVTRFERSKVTEDGLDLTIKTCQAGADAIPYSALLQSSVVIFKNVKGNVNQEDWNQLITRLQESKVSAQDKGILWSLLNNAEAGKFDEKDEDNIIKIIEIYNEKTRFRGEEYIRIGAYFFNQTNYPIKALPYLQQAMKRLPPDSPAIKKMLQQLNEVGRQDWVDNLQQYSNKPST